MLIAFKVSNFRSLKEEQALSMVASSGKELVRENTFETRIKGFPRLIRSAVIYGANSAGKSNLLLALQYMQSLVVNSASLPPGTELPNMAFRLSKSTEKKPSSFEIAFLDRAVRYEYGFSVDSKRFYSEWLIAYPQGRPQKWFERTYEPKSDSYKWEISNKLKGGTTAWRNATRENALFLSTAVQLNSEQLRPVLDWIQKKIVVVGVGPTVFNQGLTLKLLEEPDGKARLLEFIRAADFGISDFAVKKEPLVGGILLGGGMPPIPGVAPVPGAGQPSVVKVTSIRKSNDASGELVSFDLTEESNGTQRLFRSAGAWLNVLKNGEVLFVDELDTSLHPHMTRFLIELFHRSATNKKNAQLVFATHDTSLLDSDLFRRDQIWFVEKDDKSASHLYPLTDFSPRKDEALERGYLRGRYGALPFIGELDG